jgi:hypothetical protein
MIRTTLPPLSELHGGPFHGKRYMVRPGPARLSLATRRKTGPKDTPPVAIYSRNADVGPLAFVETIGLNHGPKLGNVL